MRRRVPTAVLSATAGLVLLWHTGESGAQPVLDTGPDAEVTVDGLYRVHPSTAAFGQKQTFGRAVLLAN